MTSHQPSQPIVNLYKSEKSWQAVSAEDFRRLQKLNPPCVAKCARDRGECWNYAACNACADALKSSALEL